MKVTIKKDVSRNSFSYFPHNTIYDNSGIFFNIISCGYEEIKKNYYLNRSNFHGNMLTYIVSGSGNFIFKNKEYALKKDDLIVINCMEEHTLFPNREGMIIYYMHIDSGLLTDLANNIEKKASAVFNFADNKKILDFFKTNIQKGNDSINNIDVSKQIYNLLVEIRLKVSGIENSIALPSSLERATSYIKENYDEINLSLDDVANHVNFSKYYLEKLFNKYLNTTVYRYIVSIRLTHARYLLVSTDLSVEDIALKTGFSGSQLLIRWFKKTYEETPHQFRKRRILTRM
jgi:AraC-like DNA-binding protein